MVPSGSSEVLELGSSEVPSSEEISSLELEASIESEVVQVILTGSEKPTRKRRLCLWMTIALVTMELLLPLIDHDLDRFFFLFFGGCL